MPAMSRSKSFVDDVVNGSPPRGQKPISRSRDDRARRNLFVGFDGAEELRSFD